MRRDGKTWVKNGNTFDWLEVYEPITYFPFSSIIFKNRNILLNMLILILMITLKSIKMKKTALNSSIPSTTNLEINFVKYLKRDYLLHLQLIWSKVCICEMQYCTLQWSFPWWIVSVVKIDSYRVTGYMIIAAFETQPLSSYTNTQPFS